MSILDQGHFSLEDPEGKDLLEALLNIYDTAPPTRHLVQAAGMMSAQFSWNDPMLDVWPDILERAAAIGRLRTMVALIAKDPGTHAYIIFKRLLETPAPVAGPADPYLVCLLGSGNRRAFINRSKLRKYVKDLADQGGSRVLIVTGPSSSGKSYSWYLINHVKQIGGFWPHPIDLSTWSGPPAGPADVMREVAYRLGWETPPVDRTAHEDGQARTLLAWFTGKMGKEASRYWLVFDGLDGSTTTDASLRLVEGIATAAERGNAGELRVVLIEYARLLPEDVDPYVLREPIEKIGVAELRAFLQNAARDAGQRVDDSGLDLLVQELLGSPPHPQTISLPAVSPLAGNLARRFFQANGADHG